jgi:hypothetical protein
MSIEMVNGAFVHRFYVVGGQPELLAAIQYSVDGETFAKMKLADDASRDWRDSFYVVTCMQTGRMKEFRHLKNEGVA